MAVEDKGKKDVSELSQEAQSVMKKAQQEGRQVAGFDYVPGGGGPSSNANAEPQVLSSKKSGGLSRESALGYKENGLEKDSEQAQSTSQRPQAPFSREGMADDENFDPSEYGHGGNARRDNAEPLKKDDEGSSAPNNGYGGLYEGRLDGESAQGGGGIPVLSGRHETLSKEENPEGGEGKEGENPEGGEGKADTEGDAKGEGSGELEDAKSQGKAAGMSDEDMANAEDAAKGLGEKNGDATDEKKVGDAVEKQIDENSDKLAEDAVKNKGMKKPNLGEEEEDEEGKKKKKSEEEKAKDEGTAAAGVGVASNPAAMQGQSQVGNGYNSRDQQNKREDLQRRNLEHNQQISGRSLDRDEERKPQKETEVDKKNVKNPGDLKGEAKGEGKGETKKDGEGKAEPGKKKTGFKGKAGNVIEKTKSAEDFMRNPFRWGGRKIKNAVLRFLLSHPFALIALIFAIFFIAVIFIVLLGDLAGDSSSSSGSTFSGSGCNYTGLKGITTSGTVDLTGIKVELINCDGKKDNYHVIETIDFEKYVVGVALAEVSWSRGAEYFKAQIVAARGFALRRNSAMCPSRPDNCFHGYNAETKTIRMRGCTNDQVYCDYDKVCYKYTRAGKPTLYGPEAENIPGRAVWKGQLNDSTKQQILAAAEEVKGKVLLDSSGNVVYTNFVNTDQNQWYEMQQQGMKWDEILVKHYSSSGASSYTSADCNTGSGESTGQTGSISYGDYTLSSDGDAVLMTRLDQFLLDKGTSLSALNELIADNVDDAGFGTRAGVVAAAVTLIGELGDQYNVKIPYYYGGGHHDGVKIGAVGYWGGATEDDGHVCKWSAHGKRYDVCGLDCSGFVPWAFKTGGFNMGTNYASKFQYLKGAQKVSLNANSAVVQPGDLLESSQHVILVIGIDEGAKQYVCAEASSMFEGVSFTRRSFTESGYWGVKMDGYYSNSANIRSK